MVKVSSNNMEICTPRFPKVFSYECCEEEAFVMFQKEKVCWFLSHIPAAHAWDEMATETVFGSMMNYCLSFKALFDPDLEAKIYGTTLGAWLYYLQGIRNAAHKVDGKDELLMNPVRVIARSQLNFYNVTFDFVDDTEDIKELVTPCFIADQAVIRYDGQYIRGISGSFAMPIGTMELLMPNADLIFQNLEYSKLMTAFFFPEQSYQNEEEAVADLRDPKKVDPGKLLQLLFGALENSQELIDDFCGLSIPLVDDF